jgi:hypothetical protein
MFQKGFGKTLPTHQSSIYLWCDQFSVTSCLCHGKKSSGHSGLNDDEKCWAMFALQPTKINHSCQQGVAHVSKQCVACSQEVISDKPVHMLITSDYNSGGQTIPFLVLVPCIAGVEEDETLMDFTVFSDKATFHLSGCTIQQCTDMWK